MTLDTRRAAAFDSFRQHVTERARAGDVLLVYRGKPALSVRSALHGTVPERAPGETRDRLFQLGSKARRFLPRNGHAPDARDYLDTINDTGVRALTFLFDRIHNAAMHPRRGARVIEHCSEEFQRYFSDRLNRTPFVESISALPAGEQLGVRDYYLFFVHTVGKPGLHGGTPLVSTSTDLSMARYFARGPRGTNSDPWIIHYFIPRPFEHFAVLPWQSTQVHDEVRAIGLPTIPPFGLYPRQREVSVKGALFPHFIVGIHDLTTDQFTPNPHLFAHHGLSPDEICATGIPVDQGRFADTIFDSGYVGYTATNLGGDYREFTLRRG